MQVVRSRRQSRCQINNFLDWFCHHLGSSFIFIYFNFFDFSEKLRGRVTRNIKKHLASGHVFLVTRPRSFWLKLKKKNQCQNQTKVVDSATGAKHLHVHFQTRGWVNVAFSSRCLREGGRKTFFFGVVWWKKTIGSMSHTIRYSKTWSFYSRTFVKNLSKFQRLLAMFKRQSSASESPWSRRTKSHYASWWNRRTWTMLREMRSCFDNIRMCVRLGI